MKAEYKFFSSKSSPMAVFRIRKKMDSPIPGLDLFLQSYGRPTQSRYQYLRIKTSFQWLRRHVTNMSLVDTRSETLPKREVNVFCLLLTSALNAYMTKICRAHKIMKRGQPTSTGSGTVLAKMDTISPPS
jgi:hypothetical protein